MDWSEIENFLRGLIYEDFLGNEVWRWLLAAAITLLTYLALKLAKAIVARRLRKVAESTRTRLDDLAADLVDKTKGFFYLLVSLYAGSLALRFDEKTLNVIQATVKVAIIIQAALWASALLVFAISHYMKKRMEQDAAAATSIAAIGFFARLVLWALVLVLILQNLGVEVTALVAGLGVTGIAVALASQHILGDLFASVVILLDKPFVIGDFIIVGDFLGTVEYVGLKTTRVRSLSGEQVVFSNTDLLNARVRNYKRMFERRVLFKVGVTYQTPRDKIEKIPVILREAVERQEHTRFDRAHFQAYGDFALVFETVYYVLSPDYNRYMDTHQAVNLYVHERFEAEGIEFAYPTQTVHLRQEAVPAG